MTSVAEEPTAPEAPHRDDGLAKAAVVGVRGPIVLVACPFCDMVHCHAWRLVEAAMRAAIRPAHCRGFRPYVIVRRRTWEVAA